ncbi:hypothetical protein PAXINDRAFT_168585, partial [Paxillus involutus ATCC 200175]
MFANTSMSFPDEWRKVEKRWSHIGERDLDPMFLILIIAEMEKADIMHYSIINNSRI